MDRDASRPYFANTEDLAGLRETDAISYPVPASTRQYAPDGVLPVPGANKYESPRTPRTPLDHELSELEERIDSLGAQLTKMSVILEPVLGMDPDVEKENDATAAPRLPLSPVADRIRNARERLENINISVIRLTYRIEV